MRRASDGVAGGDVLAARLDLDSNWNQGGGIVKGLRAQADKLSARGLPRSSRLMDHELGEVRAKTRSSKSKRKEQKRHKDKKRKRSKNDADSSSAAFAATGQAVPASPLTALAASTAKEEREVGEIKEMQESVQRLRNQRALVERIKQDAESKDTRISELEALVQQLRSKVSAASLQALERERNLRSKLLAAEQAASATRSEEDAMAQELRDLLNAAQRTEGALRHDLARALAEREEATAAGNVECERLEEENVKLQERCNALEDEVNRVRETAAEQGRQAALAQRRLLDSQRGASNARESLEREISDAKMENSAVRERCESLMLVHNKQRELLRTREADLQESETRENLLQGTVAELEENARLLREQVALSEDGDAGLRRALALKSRHLDESEAVCEKLRRDLAALKLESRMTVEECTKQKESHIAYQHSLQNASVHRRRMEIQLESLSEQCTELQSQLVAEMQRNAALSRQLDKEQKTRTSVSRQRLRLLEQFNDEEEKMKRTLDDPLFFVDTAKPKDKTSFSPTSDKIKRTKALLRSTVEKQRSISKRALNAPDFTASLDSQVDSLVGDFFTVGEETSPLHNAPVASRIRGSSESSCSSHSSSSSLSSSSSSSTSSASSNSCAPSLPATDETPTKQQRQVGVMDQEGMDAFLSHSPATVQKPARKQKEGTPLVARKTTACSRARDVKATKREKTSSKQSKKKHRSKKSAVRGARPF